jgi:hypothetical protein
MNDSQVKSRILLQTVEEQHLQTTKLKEQIGFNPGRHAFFSPPRCSHTWELAPALEHRAEFPQFLHQGQSVGLLGQVISSSQGLYLYTNTKIHTHIHKH